MIEKGLDIVDEGAADEDAPKGFAIAAEKAAVFEAASNVNGFVVDVAVADTFVIDSEDSEPDFVASLLIAPVGMDGNEKGAGGTTALDELLIEPNAGGAAINDFVSVADAGDDDAMEKGFDNEAFVDVGFVISEFPRDSEDTEDEVGVIPGNFGNSEDILFSDP